MRTHLGEPSGRNFARRVHHQFHRTAHRQQRPSAGHLLLLTANAQAGLRNVDYRKPILAAGCDRPAFYVRLRTRRNLITDVDLRQLDFSAERGRQTLEATALLGSARPGRYRPLRLTRRAARRSRRRRRHPEPRLGVAERAHGFALPKMAPRPSPPVIPHRCAVPPFCRSVTTSVFAAVLRSSAPRADLQTRKMPAVALKRSAVIATPIEERRTRLRSCRAQTGDRWLSCAVSTPGDVSRLAPA